MKTPAYFSFDIFLSYNSKDKTRVWRLAERLRAAGMRVWLDKEVIKPGSDIYLSVERGLEAARTLILCMSPAAFGSKWVEMERNTVLFRDPSNAGRRFIPLLLADCKIPDTIRRYKYVDYRKETDSAFEELLQAIQMPSPREHYSQPLVKERVLSSLNYSEKFVRPLHVADDRFLQVLLSQFDLRRRGKKGGERFKLRVAFDDSAPAIWNQEGKDHLLSKLPADRRAQYQRRLDDFLLHDHGAPDYLFNDPSFVFRFASGGTLPIISFSGGSESSEYYCLFFRDLHPIGWNIANGSCDTRAELLNPQDALERELREELIIADFESDKRYVFQADAHKPIDHPAHAVARLLWARKCPDKDVSALNTAEVAMKWVAGPDSLRIQIGQDKPVRREGFFLNINGEDFGIEFDKVARIRLPRRAILFDGEIDEGELVNSPIGLFSVDRFNSQLRSDNQFFKPEIVFYGAERYDGSHLDYIVENAFIPHLKKLRTPQSLKLLRKKIKAREQYGLCPVTRRIVERFNKQSRAQ